MNPARTACSLHRHHKNPRIAPCWTFKNLGPYDSRQGRESHVVKDPLQPTAYFITLRETFRSTGTATDWLSNTNTIQSLTVPHLEVNRRRTKARVPNLLITFFSSTSLPSKMPVRVGSFPIGLSWSRTVLQLFPVLCSSNPVLCFAAPFPLGAAVKLKQDMIR